MGHSQAPQVTAGGLAWMGVTSTNDELFDLLLIKSPLILIAWLLLALLPRWRYTQPIAQAIGLMFAVLYVLLMGDSFINPIDFAALSNGKFKNLFELFYSLDGVHLLFQQKSACFGGWVHYCVFDLWAGVWISRDSIERGVPQLLLIPCLLFTMMLGPSGLFLYFLIRAVWGAIFPPVKDKKL